MGAEGRVVQLAIAGAIDLDLFAAEGTRFARMRVQAGDRDPAAAAPARKFSRSRPTRTISAVRRFLATSRKWNMCGHESDGKTRSGQEHGEVLHAAARSEKFRLAGKLESDFIHASLVNRPGHNRIDLTRDRQPGGFLERGLRLARAPGSGLA